MGKKVEPPQTPDYTGAAQAQGAANLDAARLSAKMGNPNVISPYGNQTVTYQDDVPTVTQTLTPVGQQTVDLQQQAGLGLANIANQQTGKIGDILGTPFSFSGTPQTSIDPAGAIAQATDPSGYQQAGVDLSGVAKAPINAGTTAQEAIMARLAPELARQRTSAETQLINQGLRPGGEAYNNAIDALGRQENDLRTQAVLQGLGLDMSANQQGFSQALGLQGANNAATQQNYGNQLGFQQAQNAAQQQGFNQNLQGAQFGNTALQQQLAQALQIRDNPINEITALMSGSQVQNPQFQPYQGQPVAPAPVFQGTQAQGQWDMNRYEQEVAQRNALMSGIFGLASAPFSMFSFGKR